MVDLTKILNGPWTPPPQPQFDPPEAQLAAAMERAGITPPSHIQLDGKLHRFNSGTKGTPGRGDKTGWYCCFPDGVPAGRFGCWRADIEVTWRADVGRELSIVEQMAHTKRMAEAVKARDAAKAKMHEAVADVAETIWASLDAAPEWHPYLQRKGVKPNGARVTGDGRLTLPMYDPAGHLVSLQYIDNDGGKLYHASGKAMDAQWIIGDVDAAGTIYIAEGFATAATITEETGQPCAIAYCGSNLPNVAKALREKRGNLADIVVVADHDKGGIGFKYANQAAAKHGVRVVQIPIEGMDANDYRAGGHNLMALLSPAVDSGWLVPADTFCTEPAPIKWLVKHWLQEQALIMVHGPSGGGKTFVVLDWSLHIAAGLTEWHGHKVKPGPVVYLAGEGHHGLRSRVAAWKQHNKAGKLDMWVSKAGCDLNTPEGYQQALEAIRALPHPPSLINVDTLHRFLAGDENSAQDAKTMIDACAALMREFNCSVCLVHHTGVSDEVQHRARGSSAWKGALEIEISVIPGKGDAPMQIVQRKSKDAEEAQPVYVKLQSVPIAGWFDEDGEQVTSAVLAASEAPEQAQKPDSKLAQFRKRWEKAWWESGAEERDGMPYLSRSFLRTALEKDGNAKRTVDNMLNPSYTDKIIGTLIISDMIEATEHGWIFIDPTHGGAMMMAKNSHPKSP
jgi:phage/plasmid primase-like uncharacterized protein